MATLSKINDILCQNISKIDDVLKANAAKIDNIDFCTPTATPTPTVTQTPTPTPGGSQTPTPNPTKTPTQTPTFTQTPTVTITQTPTVTITQTPSSTIPCSPDCCFVELCYSPDDCATSCSCNRPEPFYLHLPCKNDPCTMAYADGIYFDDLCTIPGEVGYYSDGFDCYYWDQSTLTFSSACP